MGYQKSSSEWDKCSLSLQVIVIQDILYNKRAFNILLNALLLLIRNFHFFFTDHPKRPVFSAKA